MKYKFEYTDTFSGVANYSWVREGTVEAKSDLAAVRKVKAILGMQGIPCSRCEYCETIQLIPRGWCTILFIDRPEE